MIAYATTFGLHMTLWTWSKRICICC